MIKHVAIKNFKSLQSVCVNLEPFTVIVGKNGAGKSSFLQALQVLSWLVRYGSINDALDFNRLTYNELLYLKSRSKYMSWDLRIYAPSDPPNGNAVDAWLMVTLGKRHHAHVRSEWVCPWELRDKDDPILLDKGEYFVGRMGRNVMVAKEGEDYLHYRNITLAHSLLKDVRAQPGKFPRLTAIADHVAQFRHYEIWGPEHLRQSSQGASDTLDERGGNLPSVLHSLKSSDPGAFGDLLKELRAAYEWLDDIEFRHLGRDEYGLTFLERPRGTGRRRIKYQPKQVSDGFLRLLALTALRHQAGRIPVLGYEEPENGLHPEMLMASVKCLREVAKRGTQVIVTTHSPLLLQYMLSDEVEADPAKELKLMWRDEEGRTQIRPPRTDVLAKAKKQGVGIGELWAMMLDEKALASSEEDQASSQ